MALKNKYQIIDAGITDGTVLDQMQRSHSFSGEIDLQYLRLPDPILSLQKERGESRVFLTMDMEKNEPMGYGSVIYKDHYISGERSKIAYLGNLKVKEKYHKKYIPLPQSYEFMFSTQPEEIEPIYFSTILESNSNAIKVLTANKRFMPEYLDLGSYTTSLYAGGGKIQNKHWQIREMEKSEYADYLKLYASENSRYDFAPYLDDLLLEDLNRKSSVRLLGLFSSGELIGGGILIDPSSYKQTIVRAYKGKYKYKTLLNIYSRINNLPLFPESGSKLSLHYLSYIAIKNSDKEYLKALLRGASKLLERHDIIVLGFCDRHPYHIALKKMNAIRYQSRMYVVRPRTEEVHYEVDENIIPHFECIEL